MDSGRSGAEAVPMRISASELVVDVLDSSSLGLSLGPPRGVPDGAELEAGEVASRATSIESEGRRYLALPLRVGIPGADSVAVFADGGSSRAKARISSSGREPAPVPVSVRVVSRSELRVSFHAGGCLDACAAAAAATAAAASVGYSDRGAMVVLRSGALWAEWASRGDVYVVGRPEYVFRGEYYLPDD
jgi:hypothetical protein